MPADATPTVLLDALGTLVELERPAPHLRRELAARGIEVPAAAAEEAMRAEIAYYQAHHHRAGTLPGLAELRRACAGVIGEVLGSPLPLPELEAVLLAAVRFRPYPDTVPALRALRAAGCRLVVVSNWDVSLHEVLERTGLAPLLDGALSSAEAGAAKPDPALLLQALALVGGAPERATMVGDSVATDVAAARAAGVEAVLVDRGDGDGLRSRGAGAAAPAGVRTLPSLAGLPELVRYRPGTA